MKSSDGIPTAINIPGLHVNVEGLRRYSYMDVFAPEPRSVEHKKLGAWLIHTVTSAARHYSKARELVQLQDNADQQRDGGAIFYILDVSEQLEDCIVATYRVCAGLVRMRSFDPANEFTCRCRESIAQLRLIRNQFEHMRSQIVPNETGPGPICIEFGDEGKTITFRRETLKTARLHELIERAFRAIAELYPVFDVNSAPEACGPTKLTMTATITVTDGNNDQKNQA